MSPAPPYSRLFFVSDAHTNTQFLVDTGSEVSVIPPTPTDRRCSLAVNDTPIRTYGKRSLTLNLGLRRSLPWIFIIADVQKPILGADFLKHFGLMVDISHRKLVDTHTPPHSGSPLLSEHNTVPEGCYQSLPNPPFRFPLTHTGRCLRGTCQTRHFPPH